jgi:hypothetical protein
METSPASHHAVIMIVIMTVMLARVLVKRKNCPVLIAENFTRSKNPLSDGNRGKSMRGLSARIGRVSPKDVKLRLEPYVS